MEGGKKEEGRSYLKHYQQSSTYNALAETFRTRLEIQTNQQTLYSLYVFLFIQNDRLRDGFGFVVFNDNDPFISL